VALHVQHQPALSHAGQSVVQRGRIHVQLARQVRRGEEKIAELGLDKSAADTGTRGTVVLGTVHTDIHDIGKNIVASVLSANGFKVVDLGVDVPAQQFVDAVKESGARVVGLSCLLTTAFPAMQETVAAFKEAGLRDRVTIMIGGGPVNSDLAAQLGADGAGVSAQDAVILAGKAVEGGAS